MRFTLNQSTTRYDLQIKTVLYHISLSKQYNYRFGFSNNKAIITMTAFKYFFSYNVLWLVIMMMKKKN